MKQFIKDFTWFFDFSDWDTSMFLEGLGIIGIMATFIILLMLIPA